HGQPPHVVNVGGISLVNRLAPCLVFHLLPVDIGRACFVSLVVPDVEKDHFTLAVLKHALEAIASVLSVPEMQIVRHHLTFSCHPEVKPDNVRQGPSVLTSHGPHHGMSDLFGFGIALCACYPARREQARKCQYDKLRLFSRHYSSRVELLGTTP